MICEACNSILDTSRQFLMMHGSVCAACGEPYTISGVRIKSLAEVSAELAINGYTTTRVPKGLLP